MISADFSTVLPELVLAIFAMGALMFGVYTGKDKVAPLINWATAGVFLALALWIGFGGEGERSRIGAGSLQREAL